MAWRTYTHTHTHIQAHIINRRNGGERKRNLRKNEEMASCGSTAMWHARSPHGSQSIHAINGAMMLRLELYQVTSSWHSLPSLRDSVFQKCLHGRLQRQHLIFPIVSSRLPLGFLSDAKTVPIQLPQCFIIITNWEWR